MHHTTLVALAALCCSPVLEAQRLIVGTSSRVLTELDPFALTETPIGTISSNASTLAGLAYDPATGRLFASSSSNDALYLIDQTNWSAKLIGSYGSSTVVMHGLEWDSSTGTLYGYSSHTGGGLYTIDTTTGAATQVGPSGLTSFGNLGYDAIFDVMYLTNSSTDSYYTIDRSTGVPTLIGPLNGPTNPHELSYYFNTLTMYLVCSSTDTLYTVDSVTGATTAVMPLVSGNYLAMVYIPGSGRLSRTAHGCGPTTIFASGNPNLGGPVSLTVENTTGIPLVGFGTTALGVPFCGCTIGHEWAVLDVGPTVTLSIPATASLIGAEVYAQGADFLGAGGCPSPMLTLTDTITIQIGG